VVGGYRWRLDYYPNGFTDDDEEFISVILVPEEDLEGQEADIKVAFSFIDQPEFRMSPNFRKSGIPPRHCYVAKKLIRRDILERSRHFKNDSFIIRCGITVEKAPADASTSSFVETDMQSDLGNLLWSEEGADITFEVGDQTFAAHRCVLAARSPVFRKELFGGSLTKKDIVEINDVKPEIFSDLLFFIYTDSFSWNWEWMEDEEDDSGADEYVTDMLQLLEAADRYGLQKLKSICAEDLVQCTRLHRVADIIVVAERSECRSLKDSCVEFIKSNSSLYTAMTADSLNQIMRTCSPSVLKELLSTFAT
jgi:speckle-type POZ protein